MAQDVPVAGRAKKPSDRPCSVAVVDAESFTDSCGSLTDKTLRALVLIYFPILSFGDAVSFQDPLRPSNSRASPAFSSMMCGTPWPRMWCFAFCRNSFVGAVDARLAISLNIVRRESLTACHN